MARKLGTDHHSLYTLVTPAMAEDLLDHNTHNRPLRPGMVEKYARDMKAGLWERNAQPVTVDTNGAIHNGQHRLFAVIEAGIPVELMLLTGLDPATVITVDTGAPRSYGDYRKLKGSEHGQPIKNVTVFQGVIRLVHWYENKWPNVRLTDKAGASHHELEAVANGHPAIGDSVDFVANSSRLKNIVTPTLLAFVYSLAFETHPVEAAHWLHTLKENEGDKNNPAISLRARLTAAALSGHRLDRVTALVFLIKSWNAFARGETLATYRWAHDEPIPAIYGTPKYTGKLAAQTLIKAAKREGRKVGGIRTGRKKVAGE